MHPSRFARVIGLGLLPGAIALRGEPVPPDPRCGSAGAAGALAIVDGRAVTLADLPPADRGEILGLEAAIARARREALEEAIDDRLLAMEARKRRVTADRLYFTEIVRRAAPATDEEIRAEFAALPDRPASATLEDAREWLAGTVREKHESELFVQWTAAARRRTAIVYRTDLDAPRRSPDDVLALVGGKPVTRSGIAQRLRVKRDEVEQRVDARERAAVAAVVRARLLEAEALRRQTSPEDVVRVEITEKIRPVSDEDVATFFEEHRGEFDGDPASSRAMVADFLRSQARETTEQGFFARLQERATVRTCRTPPEAVVLSVSSTGAPSRGDPAAPVTIVEFADFECPACGQMYPQLEESLAVYGPRVRLVYRHFPLGMHPHAFRAAEASVAARAEGRFWDFADVLFTNQRALDDASLRRYASGLGLDADRFAQALDSGAGGVAVVHDMREARALGVKWTPVLFVNGIRVRGPLRVAIDAALASARKPTRSPP